MKVKNIKSKVAAKVAKGKEKVAAKCGKAKKACAIVLMAALCSAICGCKMGEQPTAQRAQTAITTVEYIVKDGGRATFNFGAEFVSQAQANETSGTESFSSTPTATPTVTTDTDAALDIPVNKANSGTSAAGGAAEKLLGAGADWLSGKIGGSTAATNAAPNAAPTATTAAPNAACPDCEYAPNAASCPDCADAPEQID